jgi:O-antigen ligase
MTTLNDIALTTNDRVIAPPRTMGSAFMLYCIALPLFGRAVFPLARDKAHITLASSFGDPQMLATYLLAAAVTFRVFTSNSLPREANPLRLVRMLLVFVAVCLLSSLNSRLPLFSIWRCFEVTLLSVWAYITIQDSAATGDPTRALRAFYGIIVAILIGVFVGLIINPGGAWAMEGDVARLTGTSGYSISPNDIGAIAAVIAVGSYVRAVERQSLKHAAAAAFFIGVCYVTHSRGGYVALAAGFLAANVMLGRLAQRRAALVVTGVCVAVAVGVVALVSHEVRDFFVFLMTRGHESENLESLGGRLQLWEFGLNIFKQHLYFGTGYGTYPEGLEGGHFHNVLIELLVTTGVVGTIVYFSFLSTLLVTVVKSIGRTNQRLAAERITAADLVTIPSVIVVANCATASAAYYSWDLLGLVSVAVAASTLVAGKVTAGDRHAPPMRFSNLLR